MALQLETESSIVFKIDNIQKALAALSQTIMQLKGVAYIGDEKKTKALILNAIDLTGAIEREIYDLKNSDAVDEAINKEVNERLLSLLREASFNVDRK